MLYMKKFLPMALALALALSLAACGPKTLPMEQFSLGAAPINQVEVPGEGDKALLLDYYETEVETLLELPLTLPAVEGLTVTPSATGPVEVWVEGDTLGILGAAPSEGETVTLVFAAEGYEESTVQLMVGFLRREMTLEVLDAETLETLDLTLPVEMIAEGETILPLAFLEGAVVTVEDLFPDDPVVEASVEEGSLVIKALKEGETVLGLTAALEPNYHPAYLEVMVTVAPKPAPPPPQQPTTQTPAPAAGGSGLFQTPNRSWDNDEYTDIIADVVYYTNQERAAVGVAPLTYVPGVDVPAGIRAEEASGYWSHTRPDGRSFDTVFKDVGLRYGLMGENLYAINIYPTGKQIVDGLMTSPDHKAAILNPSFVGIGVGVSPGGDGWWYACQLFVRA